MQVQLGGHREAVPTEEMMTSSNLSLRLLRLFADKAKGPAGSINVVLAGDVSILKQFHYYRVFPAGGVVLDRDETTNRSSCCLGTVLKVTYSKGAPSR